MQILSDTDTDLTDSFLLTPQSSDSDFDELLESDSLGERSTTSTVPTHNSSFPRLQHHILSRLSFTNLTGLATEMSGRDQIGMYSQSAMLYIRRLVWASVAVAGVATLVAAVFARDTSSQQVFYKYLGYQSWCISSSSLCTSILTRIHPIMSYLATFELRILKKRKLLTHLLCSKYPISPTSFTCIPPEYPAQAYLAFTTSLRELLYTAGQIFAAVVVLNLLSARTRSSSIAAVPNAITSGRIADGGFALADVELIPLFLAAACIPWDGIVLQFFRIYGVFDSYDRRNIVAGTKYLLLCGFWLRRVAARRFVPAVKRGFNNTRWGRPPERKIVRWKGLNEDESEGLHTS